MMKRLVCTAAILSTFLCQTFAGVVVEMVSKDLRSNRQNPPDKAYAQGGMLRIEPYQEGGAAIAMIFRDDALLILNHQDKSYFRMDQQTVAQLSSQISEAMQQMQEQLKNLPPEQRALMEQMLKGRMPDGMSMGGSAQGPALRIEPAGSERVEQYSCEMYEVYRGQEKTQEICVVSVNQLGALGQVMDSFRTMARFTKKLVESTRMGTLANMTHHPFQILDEIEGFPVLTRHFENGQPTHEVLFRSATEQNLGDDLFSVPIGYRKVDPFAQGGRR